MPDQGVEPACVTTCPTKARHFGDILDPDSEVADLLKGKSTVRLNAEGTDTKPNMLYLTKTAPEGWPVEPAPPAPITLWRRLAKPLVWAMTGMNALVVMVMLGRQLTMGGENAPAPQAEKEANDG